MRLLCTSDQLLAGRYLHNTQKKTQRTSIHAISEIRTRDPSNPMAEDNALDATATRINTIPYDTLVTLHKSITTLYFTLSNSVKSDTISSTVK